MAWVAPAPLKPSSSMQLWLLELHACAELLKSSGLLTRLGVLHDPNGAAPFNGIYLTSHVSETIVKEAKKRLLTQI